MIPTRKKVKHVQIPKRKSDRLMTLKTQDIVGHGKHAEDPLVIPKEKDIIGGSVMGKNTLDDIQKGLSQ